MKGVNTTCTFTHVEDPSMEDDEDIDSGSLTYLYFANSWFGSVKPASNVDITDNHC